MAKRKSKSESNSPQHNHYIAIVAVVAVVAVVILVMNSMKTSTPVEEMAMGEVMEAGEDQALAGQAGSNVQYCKGLGAACPSGLTCRQGRNSKGNLLGSSSWRCLKLLWKGAQCDNDYQCASKDCNSVGVCGDGGEYSTAMGQNTVASGTISTAMGSETEASGMSSTAMGSNTEASGARSTAMGIWTKASGHGSTAIGNQNTASGYYSTAMGSNTEASGYYSTAMGTGTIASGPTSTSMGYETVASGISSTAMGGYAVAEQDNTFVVGLTSTKDNKCTTTMHGQFKVCGNINFNSLLNSAPDESGVSGAVCITKEGNLYVDNSGSCN